VAEVYMRHGLERPFTLSNYKEVLRGLEAGGRITATPPAAERPADTMADHVVAAFPARET
jgi:hypothetical protein